MSPAARLFLALGIATIAAGLGYWLAVDHYRPRLEAAADRADQIEGAYRHLAGVTQRQNEAITALEQATTRRREKAQTVVTSARNSAAGLRLHADGILRTPLPAGADPCQAAGAAFDDELRQERGA